MVHLDVAQFLDRWTVSDATTPAATATAAIYKVGGWADRLYTYMVLPVVFAGEALRGLLARAVAYTFSPFSFMCLFVVFIFNRTLVFSSARQSVYLRLGSRLVLRGCSLAVLARAAYPFAAVALKNERVNPESPLRHLYMAACFSYFVELLSAVIQGQSPVHDTGFSLFEYNVIFQDVQSSWRTIPHEIAVLCLLVIGAHMVVHVQGFFNNYRYRFIPSALVYVAFIAHLGWLTSNQQLHQYPSLALFSLVRFIPQLVILAVIFVCGALYLLTASIVGFRNMNLQHSFNFSLADTLPQANAKLGFQLLAASAKDTYLTEAASIYLPLATWIDAMHVRSLESVSATGHDGTKISIFGRPANPYANEIGQAPQTRKRVTTTTGMVESVRSIWYRLLTAVQLVWSGVTLIYVRFRAKHIEEYAEPASGALEFICDRIYGRLDEMPSSYPALLNGMPLPELDDSADFVDDNFESSGAENDDEDGLESDDEALCAETIIEVARDRHGAALLAGHMLAEHAVTRQGFLQLDPAGALANVIQDRRQGTDPQNCVVCLAAPRQIVLWPCRCLALCDDCRTALSLKRFKDCCCCRQPVHSYSRLFRP